jgi:hypothetical protein
MRLLGTARKSEHTNKFMNFRNSFLSTEQSKNVKKIIETYNWARKRPKTIYLAYCISHKVAAKCKPKNGKKFLSSALADYPYWLFCGVKVRKIQEIENLTPTVAC